MKSEKSSGKESIQSSLNSLFLYTSISGIPTSFGPRNHSRKNRILGYFGGFLSLTCLLLNCCFQTFNFFQNVVIRFCEGSFFYLLKSAPTKLFEYSLYYLTPSFLAGIPLIFAFQFYFSRKLRKIFDSFQEMEELISPTKSFYRKCRIGCLVLISVSFIV